MDGSLLGVQGSYKGMRFPLGADAIVFGRDAENDVVLAGDHASRVHAEVRHEHGEFVVHDRGSSNGTFVNGDRVTTRRLAPGDRITMGYETFLFEVSLADTVALIPPGHVPPTDVLRVIISGGGPVGLSLALLLESLLGPRVHVTIYDSRWTRVGARVVWKTPEQGNVRRQQVVTIQSRQYRRLPQVVQDRLFTAGTFSEMWPHGLDSIEELGPRNIRISHVEDQLLALANDHSDRIDLVAELFDPVAASGDVAAHHVLAICEGSRSHTLNHYVDRFGSGDPSLYAVDGKHLQDMVLGLRVKSELTDQMAVLLTVAQNRFLLNSLKGDGFLNMRLTDAETEEACGIDPVHRTVTPCVQSEPCVLDLRGNREFFCAGHKAVFLPALLKDSPLWTRVQDGLALFGVPPENLTAVTGFRLEMTQRARFTAQLYPRTATTPGTFGFLLGDAANAIHFWPGRGLNSGLASVQSLARCLATVWNGRALRDADFLRHEAVMAMLQYRHKTRAWRQMVTANESGDFQAIKDRIAIGIAEADQGHFDLAADRRAFTDRLMQIRDRLGARIRGMPDDDTLNRHLDGITGELMHTLVTSDPWDTSGVGGEEVDVEWLLKTAASAELVSQDR